MPPPLPSHLVFPPKKREKPLVRLIAAIILTRVSVIVNLRVNIFANLRVNIIVNLRIYAIVNIILKSSSSERSHWSV